MLPPPVALPNALNIPSQPLAMPQFDTPEWEPIPVYRPISPEDVKTGTRKGEKDDKGESADKDKDIKTPERDIPEVPDIPVTDVVIPEMNEVNTVTIPIIEVEVPLPKTEIVVIAVTTATVSAVAAVGGTMAATSLFRFLMKVLKPTMKSVVKKLAKLRGKEVKSWARQRREDRRLRVKGE